MGAIGTLVIGVIIGAGLVFGTLYASGSMTQKTVTQTTQGTVTKTSIQILTQTSTTVSTETVTTTVTVTTLVATIGPSVQLSVVTCVHGPAGNAAGSAYCELSLTNIGTSPGAITGCSLYGGVGTLGPGTAPPVSVGVVIVPVGTSSASPVNVVCDGLPMTSGAAVSGSLTVGSESPLAFSAIAA